MGGEDLEERERFSGKTNDLPSAYKKPDRLFSRWDTELNTSYADVDEQLVLFIPELKVKLEI